MYYDLNEYEYADNNLSVKQSLQKIYCSRNSASNLTYLVIKINHATKEYQTEISLGMETEV